MTSYIPSRILGLFLTLFGLSATTFLLMNLIPGGPFTALDIGGVSVLSPEVVDQLRRQYGLDKPLWQQYLTYVWRFLHGDMGWSVVRNEEVTRIVAVALPNSLLLGSVSLVVSFTAGLTLGVGAAIRRNTWVDHLATVTSIAGVAVPSFVLGLLMIVIFSLQFGLLPVAGWGTWKHLVLPVLALSAEPIAIVARYTRSAMLETLQELYVTVARSKGLSERIVFWKHALRNALIPVVTVLGLVVPRLLVGSFLVETIFAIPGSGRFLVVAVNQRDYPLVMAMAILYAAIVALMNLIVDLAYLLLNPRLRYG